MRTVTVQSTFDGSSFTGGHVPWAQGVSIFLVVSFILGAASIRTVIVARKRRVAVRLCSTIVGLAVAGGTALTSMITGFLGFVTLELAKPASVTRTTLTSSPVRYAPGCGATVWAMDGLVTNIAISSASPLIGNLLSI